MLIKPRHKGPELNDIEIVFNAASCATIEVTSAEITGEKRRER